MNTKTNHAQHVEMQDAPHLRLRRRAGAALVSGCLALSMCPAIALAQPADAPEAPQGDNPTAQQQGPQGQGRFNDEFDGQIRDILIDNGYASGEQPGAPGDGQQPPAVPTEGSDSQQPPAAPNDGTRPPAAPEGEAPDGASTPDGNAPAAPGIPNGSQGMLPGEPPTGDIEDNGAPAIPEGEVNVQQIIDLIRGKIMEQAKPAGDAQTPNLDGTVPGDSAQAPEGAPEDAPEAPGNPFAGISKDDLVQMVLDLVNELLDKVTTATVAD